MNNNFKKRKILIKIIQISIGVMFLILRELFSKFELFNSFIFSSPSRIISTIIELYKNNNLFNNIFVTLYELFISFGLGSIVGFLVALLLYKFDILKKIFDP